VVRNKLKPIFERGQPVGLVHGYEVRARSMLCALVRELAETL
jgi:hypothetical protein